MPRPGNSFKPLLIHFLVAIDAQAKFIGLDAPEGFVNQLQNGAVGVGLAEEKLLSIGIGSFVSQVDCWIVVCLTTFFLGSSDIS